MLRWITLGGAILLGSTSLAQTRRTDTPIFGLGTTTCQQIAAADKRAHAREWLFGYLTAFGESFGPPSTWLGDTETVSSIFDETCAAFPKFTAVEAARWVILTLQDRRYKKRSERLPNGLALRSSDFHDGEGDSMADRFSDNTSQGRFELDVDGQTVFAVYRRTGDKLAIFHVEAPPALRGTGAAGRLMQHVADAAKAENLGIVPYCGYAASWLRRRAA